MKNRIEIVEECVGDESDGEYLLRSSKRDRDEAFENCTGNEIQDSVIEAILQKRKISSIIADMKSEMVYTQEEIDAAVTAGEKILIEKYDDPSKIDIKLRIENFKTADSAYKTAFYNALDNKKQLKLVYESELAHYRKLVEKAWNQRHPLLPGILTRCNVTEVDVLWIKNK